MTARHRIHLAGFRLAQLLRPIARQLARLSLGATTAAVKPSRRPAAFVPPVPTQHPMMIGSPMLPPRHGLPMMPSTAGYGASTFAANPLFNHLTVRIFFAKTPIARMCPFNMPYGQIGFLRKLLTPPPPRGPLGGLLHVLNTVLMIIDYTLYNIAPFPSPHSTHPSPHVQGHIKSTTPYRDHLTIERNFTNSAVIVVSGTDTEQDANERVVPAARPLLSCPPPKSSQTTLPTAVAPTLR